MMINGDSWGDQWISGGWEYHGDIMEHSWGHSGYIGGMLVDFATKVNNQNLNLGLLRKYGTNHDKH